jgi:hypothetical protein
MLMLLLPSLALASGFAQLQITISITVMSSIISISGTVTDESGAPVADASISLEVKNPFGGTVRVTHIRTDSAGIFSDQFGLLAGSPSGNYTVYVRASKEPYIDAYDTAQFSFYLGDFILVASQSQISVQQGSAGTIDLTVSGVYGFADPVALEASGFPAGVSYRFSRQVALPNSTLQMSIEADPSTTSGSYHIYITATGGGRNRNVGLILYVTERPEPILPILLIMAVATGTVIVAIFIYSRMKRAIVNQKAPTKDYVAATRVLVRLEELRAQGGIQEEEYRKLRKEYEEKIRRSVKA